MSGEGGIIMSMFAKHKLHAVCAARAGKLSATDTADGAAEGCHERFGRQREIYICRVSFERNLL